MERDQHVVLSDVHGYRDLVHRVVDHYGTDMHYVFNGDVVDRGPDSKGTLDLIQQLDADLILGNHEWVLLAALSDNDRERRWAWYEMWLGSNGGVGRGYEDGVLESYDLGRRSNPIETAHYLHDRMQELGHLTLLKEASLYYETSDLLVVHAGLAHWIRWNKQRAQLDALSSLKSAGIFTSEPEQIVSYDYAVDWQRPADVIKTLVTGHYHKRASTGQRTYGETQSGQPHRIQLASHLTGGDPLFAYESWTGKVRAFEQ